MTGADGRAAGRPVTVRARPVTVAGCASRPGAVSWRSRPSWWWAEPSRSRSARSPRRASGMVSYPVRGALRGAAFDLADGESRSSAAAAATRQVRAHRALRVRPRRRRPRAGCRHGIFSVRSRCPTSLMGRCTHRLSRDRARQPPARGAHAGGNVQMRGYRGSAQLSTGERRRSTSAATAGTRSTRARGRRRHASTPSARRRRCRCARTPAPSARCCRPDATTSTPRAALGRASSRPRRSPRVRTRRTAVTGAQRLGRRRRSEGRS